MAVLYTNNAIGHLSAAIDADDTTITLMSGNGGLFPAIVAGSGDWFPSTLVKVSGEREIVKVTARSGDVFTVVRAQEGTPGLSWAVNDRFELRMTAAVLNQYVPDSRTVNGKPLTTNIVLSAADVDAIAIEEETGNVTQAVKFKNVKGLWTSMATTPMEMGHLGGAAGDFLVDIHTDGGETSQDYKYRFTFKNDGTGVQLSAGSWFGAIVGHGAYASQYDLKAAFYQTFTTASTSSYCPIIKQQVISTSNNQNWVGSMGWLVANMEWCLHLRSSTGGDCLWTFKTADKSFTGPGKMVPADYTNFDDRFNAKYVQGVQLGAKVSYSASKHEQETSVSAGHCQTGVYTVHSDGGGGELTYIYGKPIQRNINGTWATVSG